MSENIVIPKDIHDQLIEEYERLASESGKNPWMTFSEFIVAVVKLGEKRFMELAEKNRLGLGEFLKFIEAEVT